MIPDAKESELLKQGYYNASGTVLKRKDGVKSEQYLQLFLKGHGIIQVSAPTGAKSRFAGACEPMTWGNYELYKSPSRFYVKSAEVKEDFLSIRGNPKKLATAVKLYRLISKTLYREHENDKVLTLLWSSMLLLAEGISPEAVKFRFTWRLLKYLGIAPSLTNCVRCSAVLDKASPSHDGFLCQKCAAADCRISTEQLSSLQAAAMLPQDKFTVRAEKETAAGRFNGSNFEKFSEYLETFFANLG